MKGEEYTCKGPLFEMFCALRRKYEVTKLPIAVKRRAFVSLTVAIIKKHFYYLFLGVDFWFLSY